jgi:hypothetical protein
MPRTLFRLLAGSAAGFVALATAAVPAHAAAGDITATPFFPDVTISANGTPKGGPMTAVLSAPDGTPTAIDKIRITVDLAGAQALLTAATPSAEEPFEGLECTTSGTRITCIQTGEISVEHLAFAGITWLDLSARKGAAVGASGTLSFEAQADDGPVGRSTSTVTIGEDVDLAAVKPEPLTVAPGTVQPLDLRVSNVGGAPVAGAVLVLSGLGGLSAGDGFSTCTYGSITVCSFDETLATGTAYRTSAPWPVTVPKDAAAGSRARGTARWLTVTEWQEYLAHLQRHGDENGNRVDLGRPGTGPDLHLTAVPAAARGPQVDDTPGNARVPVEVVVGGSATADLAAIGATVTGAVGDRVEIQLGAVNDGPATLYPEVLFNNQVATVVVVPSGLKAVQIDDRCRASTSQDEEAAPGAPEYVCAPSEPTVPTGTELHYDFTFEIRQGATDEAGQVVVNDPDRNLDTPFDKNADNDRSAITVSVSGGGTLPITGVNVGLIAGGGALLLAVGAAGVLAVRRRRVRFTA